MNTNKIAAEELRKSINELRERLFEGLISSLSELDEFFDKHVKSGRIDPSYKSQYKDLLDRFKQQLDEFCEKVELLNLNDIAKA